MFLESNERIRDQIERLIDAHDVDDPIAIAVAFWGAGAESMLRTGKRFRVICNLTMGGTNPSVIETLMAREGIEVRHLPDLHAKVVLSTGGAVVSSANFSANGLGLEDEIGWQEAGMLVAPDGPEFVKVYAWFEARWRVALAVDSGVLVQARKAWQDRASLPSIAMPDAVKASTVADVDTPPALQEADLFAAKIKGRDRLRMAAEWLVDEYRTMKGGSLSPSDSYIPAYVAYGLWTLSGRTMGTNIPNASPFSRPDQVLRRAEDVGQQNPDRVRNLIARLARVSNTPPAVRYWAQQWMVRDL